MARARVRGRYIWMLSLAAAGSLACSGYGSDPQAGALLSLGTWGGDAAGMIVGDTATHLHVGCTFGDVSGRIALQPNGTFSAQGSYVLRAYPILVGPAVPARFTGQVIGNVATVTVTVDDTVQHETVVKGPVVLTLGEPAQMGNCPICRRPVITTIRLLR
ncbi:MAG: hypothetical protein ABIY52_14715 [Gemmatimonadaceae bacterium]